MDINFGEQEIKRRLYHHENEQESDDFINEEGFGFQKSINGKQSIVVPIDGIVMRIEDLILWENDFHGFRYNRKNFNKAILKGVSFEIPRKKLVGILGEQKEAKYLMRFLSG